LNWPNDDIGQQNYVFNSLSGRDHSAEATLGQDGPTPPPSGIPAASSSFSSVGNPESLFTDENRQQDDHSRQGDAHNGLSEEEEGEGSG